MDGWNKEELPQLSGVLSDIYNLDYELSNCIRGCYTNCYTYDELKTYIEELADRLKIAASECDYIQDEPEDDEDE